MLKDKAFFTHRGIRLDNNEWTYGALIVKGQRAYILTEENSRKMRVFEEDGLTVLLLVEVDINSIGACTNVEDADGNYVFIGDILRTDTNEQSPDSPFLDNYCGEVMIENGNIFADAYENLETYDFKYCHIIGNIYETPELLN